MINNWFPLGLASGKAFCNREHERNQLAENFNNVRHSLIISPRRYGKTSLVMQTMEETKQISSKVDFFSVNSVQGAQQRILSGIGSLIPKMMNKTEQALQITKDFFRRFHLTVQYEKTGFSIGITSTEMDVTQTIVSSLQNLEKIAEKTNKKVVLFFDEMQMIGLLGDHLMVEAAIREVAQESRYVSYVFSGSNRRLLGQLFDDSSRPLYLLCHRMNIERISVKEYYKHLQKAAHATWKKNLDETVITKITQMTERHPYYMNALCSRLWAEENLPTEEDVYDCWLVFAAEEKSRISGELEQLAHNQRNLLINIAKVGYVKEPTGQVFLKKSNLSSASAFQSLDALLKKDYIEERKEGYCLIDPLMKTLLSYF